VNSLGGSTRASGVAEIVSRTEEWAVFRSKTLSIKLLMKIINLELQKVMCIRTSEQMRGENKYYKVVVVFNYVHMIFKAAIA